VGIQGHQGQVLLSFWKNYSACIRHMAASPVGSGGLEGEARPICARPDGPSAFCPASASPLQRPWLPGLLSQGGSAMARPPVSSWQRRLTGAQMARILARSGGPQHLDPCAQSLGVRGPSGRVVHGVRGQRRERVLRLDAIRRTFANCPSTRSKWFLMVRCWAICRRRLLAMGLVCFRLEP